MASFLICDVDLREFRSRYHFESQQESAAGSLHLQGEAQQLQGSHSEEGLSQHHVDHHGLRGKCWVMQEISRIMTVLIIPR